MKTRKPVRRNIAGPLRRLWTLAVVESGETEQAIARREGVDLRTVRKHVARGRDELVFERARARVFERALEKHFEQLTALAAGLLGQLTVPVHPLVNTRPLFDATSTYGGQLLGALRLHVPRSPIWRRVAEWNQLVERLRETKERVKARTRPSVGEVVGTDYLLFEEAQAQIETSSPLDRRGFVFETDGANAKYGAFGWSLAKPNMPATVEEVDRLLVGVAAWPEVAEGRVLLVRLDQLRAPLSEELEAIVLRQVLPGTCPFCPGLQSYNGAPRKRRSAS